ncbi:MAG: PRC-barrel domain-containing protein [Acidimicrobiia bacterium]|nr:PRC-barrel domain-containing protein [Acidimicrobiia bacterium]
MTHSFRIKLGDLLKRPVIDSQGVRVGVVEDVWLEEDDTIWLVVGGSIIDELLGKLKIRPDIELLVPSEVVDKVSDKEITLKWTMFQLESTCEDCWTREKERLVQASIHADQDPGLHLISRGLWDFDSPSHRGQ